MHWTSRTRPACGMPRPSRQSLRSLQGTWVALAWAVLFASSALAEPFRYEFSNYGPRGTGRPTHRLEVNRQTLTPFEFFERTGGVDFGGISRPLSESDGHPVSVVYDASRPDGSRLVVKQNGTEVVLRESFPDWVLLPTIAYVESQYTSCVSLFGPDASFAEHNAVYHPALDNTLLGLRLLQADVFLIDPVSFMDPPRLVTGGNSTTPTGNGEPTGTVLGDTATARRLASLMEQYSVDTWVLESDALAFETRPEVSLRGRLKVVCVKLKGHPPSTGAVDTSEVSNQISEPLLRAAAPGCFDAASKCARLAGFLRFVKETNPAAWAAVTSETRGRLAEPRVLTPDRFPKYPRGVLPTLAVLLALLVVAVGVLIVGTVWLVRRLRRKSLVKGLTLVGRPARKS